MQQGSVSEPSARVLLDSININGQRLTTMEVTMHRFVLSEFNTHRVFSRNSASSRAIPVSKRLSSFFNDTAYPLSLPAEQPGMQGGAELEEQDADDAFDLLAGIRNEVGRRVANYIDAHPDNSTRLHKSVLNRYLEPFLWHTVIVSSTEWENFFVQRCSPLAQPEIRVVAELIRDAFNNSTPQPRVVGNRNSWHTPLILGDEYTKLTSHERIAVSVARCARVSYLTHDGKRDINEDLKLFCRLVEADPPHWSPLEHVALPAAHPAPTPGNFDGWHQLRHQPGWIAEVHRKAKALTT